MLKKADLIAFVAVLLTSMLCFGIFKFVNRKPAATVIITQNNETVFEGSIHKDKDIELSGNTIIIRDGTVYIKNADCKNQICVNHKSISKSGETIACLPNKVLVRVE